MPEAKLVNYLWLYELWVLTLNFNWIWDLLKYVSYAFIANSHLFPFHCIAHTSSSVAGWYTILITAANTGLGVTSIESRVYSTQLYHL